MRSDGTHREKLTNGKFDLSPAWSAGRKTIAYRHSSCRCGKAQLALVKVSSGTIDFVTGVLGSDPDNPDWMSSSRLVFDQKDSDGERNIFSIKTDGSGLTPITNGGLAESIEPDWSPAAKRIVFLTRDENSETGMVTVKKDGGDQQTVISPNLPFLRAPAWSPSGKRIAYSEDGKLCLIKPDGSGHKCLDLKVGFVDHPSWAPDGKRIAFDAPVSNDIADVEVYTVKPGGKGLKRLTDNDRYDAMPAW
jgi:Tol biopolymer transport system component